MWEDATEFHTGRTSLGWICSDLEASETTPSLQTGYLEMVSRVPFTEMCVSGKAERAGDDWFQTGCISEGEVKRQGYMWEKN